MTVKLTGLLRMLRSAKGVAPLYSFSFLSKSHPNDIDHLSSPPPDVPKTGWDRVKRMYLLDENGEASLEIQNVGQATMSGAIIGASIGGFVASKSAYINFVESNQATIFKTTFDAKKKLQDYVTIAFAKGAVRWGWRLSMFTGLFSLTATTVSVYRNDTSIVDYVMAGAIAGGAYKLNLGLAATFVGAGLGAVLGTIAGILIVGLLKITGLKMEDIRKSLLVVREGRKEQMRQVEEKSSKIASDVLLKHHNEIIKDKETPNIDAL